MKTALTFLSLIFLFYVHAVIGQTVTVLPTNVSCNGICNGTAMANASGGAPPYIYYWSNGTSGPMFQKINNLCPGIYTVTVQDNNFNQVGTASVSIAEPPAITFTTSTTNATNGQNNGSAKIASASGGTGLVLFTWSNSVQGQTITGLSCGTYSVTATDDNGCTKSSIAVVNCVTGINELNHEKEFSIYPNPSSTTLTIETTINQPYHIQLINLLGEIIYSTQEAASNKIIIDVGILPKGIYIVQISNKDCSTSGRQRLVVQ